MFSGCSQFTVFLIIINTFAHSAVGQYTCYDFVKDPHTNVTVSDTFVGVIQSLYISDLEDAEIINSPYLEAYVDYDGYLTVEVTQNFQKYKSEDHVTSVLSMECTDGKHELEYHINIERKFCDGITINRDQYYYVFYDSLPQNYTFDLSDSEEILVDCAEDSVEFAIEDNQYFTIKSIGSDEEGNYYATLKVLDEIKAPFDGSFNISAWDIKNPEKVVTSTVTVQIVTEVFPIFGQPTYYGEVTEDLEVIIYDGPITFDTDGNADDFNIVVATDYQDFFDVRFSSKDVELFVSPELTLENLPDFPVSLTLIIYDRYLGDTDETIVTLYGPPFLETAEKYDTETVDDKPTWTETVKVETTSSAQAASSSASEDIELVSTTIVDNDKDDGVSAEEQPNWQDESDNVEEKELTTRLWDFEDESEEEELEEEYNRINGRPRLAGFEFWATNMKAFVIALAMLSVVMIISAIIYVRNKTTAYRRYNPAY